MDYKNETSKTLSTNTPEDNEHKRLAKQGMDAALAILERYETEETITEAESLPEDAVQTHLFEALDEAEEEASEEDVFADLDSDANAETAEDSDEVEDGEITEDAEAYEAESDEELSEDYDEDTDAENDDLDDDVKIFSSENSPEDDEDNGKTKTFESPSAADKKAQTEVGFSLFEDDEEEAEAEEDSEIIEPDDSFDGEEIYEAPNTADDAEPYTDDDTAAEYEEGEVTDEDAIVDEDEEEPDSSEDFDDTYNQEEYVEKEDALKKLFYGSGDDGTVEKKKEKVKKDRKKNPKKSESSREGSEEFWGKSLGIAREVDMSDHKAVSTFTKDLEKKKANTMLSLAGAVLCFVLSMYLELAPVSGILPHPAKLLETNPAVYVLIDLQILLFSVMFMFDSLARGVETWLDHKIVTPAAASLTVVAFAALQAVITAFMGSALDSVRMLCSLGCASLVMLSLYDVLGASSALRSFRIASLSSTKFGAAKLSADSREVEAMESSKAMDGTMAVDVRKGKIYKNFVKRISTLPECEKHLWIPILSVFAVSIVIGFISGVGTKSVYQGLSNAALVYLSSVPLNLFICSALPEYVAIKRGRDINATMVGHNAGREFKKLSAVTFADTTVFLPKDTRLESQIIVDTERFCDVTLTMVKIFRHIGGPLRYVFDRNLPNPDQEIPADVKLLSVTQNYIEVSVDGKDYTVATEKHLSTMGLKFTRHDRDERYSILFLIEGDKVLAKFRIIYKVDSRFENTSRELDDVHVSIGIKTVTPGINDAFLRSLDEFKYCDFTVIRGSGEADLPSVDFETDSGVVALGSVHKFLEMLLLCENSVRRTWINSLVKLISAGFCVLVSAWLILFNHVTNLDIVFGLIIQLFWLLPVTFNSYLRK